MVFDARQAKALEYSGAPNGRKSLIQKTMQEKSTINQGLTSGAIEQHTPMMARRFPQ
jgi:hypothetical protein